MKIGLNVDGGGFGPIHETIRNILTSGADSRTMQEALKTLRKVKVRPAPISMANLQFYGVQEDAATLKNAALPRKRRAAK